MLRRSFLKAAAVSLVLPALDWLAPPAPSYAELKRLKEEQLLAMLADAYEKLKFRPPAGEQAPEYWLRGHRLFEPQCVTVWMDISFPVYRRHGMILPA